MRTFKDLKSSDHWCANDRVMMERVRRLSKGLVVSKWDGEIRTVPQLQYDHQSVQDYMSDRGISYLEARAGFKSEGRSIGRSNHFLMLGCLRYVQSLREGHYESENLDIAYDLPFTFYAMDFSMDHAAIAEAEGFSLNDLIEIAACPSNGFWAKWEWLQSRLFPGYSRSHYEVSERLKLTKMQHVAAGYGLRSILVRLYTAPASTKLSLWDKLFAYLRSSRSSPWYTPSPDTDPLDTEDFMRRTPLSLAAKAGHKAVVEFLLNTGRVNANSKDCWGRSPLDNASDNGHFGVAKLLLAIQAVDIGPWDDACLCPLIAATHGGRKAFVRALRDAGRSDSLSIRGALKATIINLAVGSNDDYLNRLQVLLAARTDSTLSHALFALEIAARMGHVQVVEGLLATKLNDGTTQASLDGATLLDLLAERHCKDEPIMIAALSAASGADLGATAKAVVVWTFITGPGFSSAGSRSDVDHLLPDLTIEQISCKDLRHSRTLLHWATEMGDEALVERCIRLGASVEAQDMYGKVPLQYAERFAIVKLLAEASADLHILTAEQVNDHDEHQKSLLHWAAETGSGDIVKRCLQLGANVESADACGETPLHYAAESGHFSIVKSLVEAGSNLDTIDVYERKPLDCALGEGPGENSNRRVDVEVVNYLTILTNSANYLDKLTSPEYQQRLMAM